jgi:hypothetical protein
MIKVIKKSQNSRNQGFSYYLCLMIEGSGSVPRTYGSKTGRPKNVLVLRIRIRNTGSLLFPLLCPAMIYPPPPTSINQLFLYFSEGLSTVGAAGGVLADPWTVPVGGHVQSTSPLPPTFHTSPARGNPSVLPIADPWNNSGTYLVFVGLIISCALLGQQPCCSFPLLTCGTTQVVYVCLVDASCAFLGQQHCRSPLLTCGTTQVPVVGVCWVDYVLGLAGLRQPLCASHCRPVEQLR